MRTFGFARMSFAHRVAATAGVLAVFVTASFVFIPHHPATSPSSDEQARISEAAAMMRVQPIVQQVDNAGYAHSQDDPVGMTDDMINVLEQEL
jgi:hypothetical protein